MSARLAKVALDRNIPIIERFTARAVCLVALSAKSVAPRSFFTASVVISFSLEPPSSEVNFHIQQLTEKGEARFSCPLGGREPHVPARAYSESEAAVDKHS